MCKWSNLVAIGHKLYAISGGATEDGDGTCSNVFFLDCRTHSWVEAASLRLSPKTNCEFDGKMYVAGTSEKPVPLKSVEVYNARTQTWNPAQPEKRMFKLRSVKGMIYMNSDAVGFDMNVRGGVCLIENIIYSYSKSSGEFHWAVDMLDVWRKVEGLEGALPKFSGYSTVRLADFGGKMMAFWDKYVPSSGYKEKVIWCAVISLEKRSSEEIWGKVEWFDVVLHSPRLTSSCMLLLLLFDS